MSRQSDRDTQFLASRSERYAQLDAQYRAGYQNLKAQRDYVTPGEYRRRLDEHEAWFRQQIAAERRQAQDAYQRFKALRDAAHGAAGRHNDPARIANAERAWDGIKAVLDRQPDNASLAARLNQFVSDAATTRNQAQLDALIANIPLYLEAREDPRDTDARARSGQSFAEHDHLYQAVTQQIQAECAPMLDPDVTEGHAAEQVMARIHIIDTGLWHLEATLANPEGVGVGFLGWEPRSYIPAGGTLALSPEELNAHGYSASTIKTHTEAPPDGARFGRFTLSNTDPTQTGTPPAGSN